MRIASLPQLKAKNLELKPSAFKFPITPDYSPYNSVPNLDSFPSIETMPIYFTHKIDPNSTQARELHEASRLSELLGNVSPSLIQKRVVRLTNIKKQKIVALDLDDTLICQIGKQTLIRPGTQAFLEKLSKIAILVLFTSADEEHALKMLKLIDPKQKYFTQICTREHCIGYLKDLRIFQTSLNDVVIVDNTAKSFIAQLSNGIPILSYTGIVEDNELEELYNFLEICLKQKDVRKIIEDTFQLSQFHKEISGKYAINKIYRKSQ